MMAFMSLGAQGMHGQGTWGWDHMMSWEGGIAMWVALLLVVALVIYLALRGIGAGRFREDSGETPLSILQKRYARGEISKEEYEAKRRDLGV
jgi:putative membrane protein